MKTLPAELALVDRLLVLWARWSRQDFRELGLPGNSAFDPGRTDRDAGLPPPGVMLVDAEIARLPKRLQRCIVIEYRYHLPREIKARFAHTNVLAFRQSVAK